MSQIKPGMLCWVVRAEGRPEFVGRVVTAVRFHYGVMSHSLLHGRRAIDAWEVSAPWLPAAPHGIGWLKRAADLKPIHDPDLDTENQNDCMDMNLLAVLPFTREAV